MIISLLKGSCTIKASGKFPERILNIASTSGIFVHTVKRTDENTLTFCVSKKGAQKLLANPPDAIKLEITDGYGLPFFWQRYKKRSVLFALPLLFICICIAFSCFIWRVELVGGDKKLQGEVKSTLSAYGVHVGALKHKIDQNDVKRRAIMEIDDLSWLWVDLKGTTAKVKIQKRTRKPSLIKINEPSDVIAMHSGVIEKMQVYCGVPLISEGMTVEKGQIIVTGVFRSENENIPTYYHHASADVTVRLNEKKTVIIPKSVITKTPTGNKKSVYKINFKKNNIKFSLNSGISYTEYDKIEKTLKIPFLPLSFSRVDYLEADVTTKPADTSAEIENRRKAFLKTLEKKKLDVKNLTEEIKESDEALTVTFNAECLVRTDKEIPIEYSEKEGETDGENS